MKFNKKFIAPLVTIAAFGALAVGSTYALFTSNDQSNIAVTSGKVSAKAELTDLVLYSGAANSLTGDPVADEANIVAQSGNTFLNGGTASIDGGTLTLTGLTPGDRVTLKIKVTNESTISVKGRSSIVMSTNDGLFAGLKVKIGGQDFNGLSRYGKWEEVTEEVQTIDVVVDFPTDKTMEFGDKSCSIQFSYDMVQLNTYTVDPKEHESELSNPTDLAIFRDLVNAGNSFAGQTIKLTDDIDMGGALWTPIGTVSNYEDSFDGTFDGDGHSISNFKVSTKFGEKSSAGLFGSCHTGTIKNLTVENADFQSDHYAAGIVGWFEGNGLALIDNCEVKDCTIVSTAHLKEGSSTEYDDGDKVGGITGYLCNASVTNSKVTDCSLTGYRDVGSIVGRLNSGGILKDSSAKNVSIINDRTHNYNNYTTDAQFCVNEIFGNKTGGTESGNSATNVTISVSLADGFSINSEGVYEISNASGLSYFASTVNSGTLYTGKTVKLTSNINLDGIAFSGIGVYKSENVFEGTFEGNEKTISNMTVSGHESAGLFIVFHGVAKDLTIDNANVTSNHYAGAFCGYSDWSSNVKMENIIVKNSTIESIPEEVSAGNWDNGDKVGGILGQGASGPNVLGCTVKDSTIKGYRDIGGVVGQLQTGNANNNTVTNVTLISDRTHNYNGYTTDAQFNVNDIVGRLWAEATSEGNTSSGVVKQYIGA